MPLTQVFHIPALSDKATFFRIVRRIIDSRRNSASTSVELPFIDALLSAQLPEATTEGDAVTYLIGGVHTSGYCELGMGGGGGGSEDG